jgi:aspartyl-tRNA(Asn)/glutamyl-tRNA(Gln) amidotransferase subunit C
MVAFGMPGRLTRADVDRIAALARLELSDSEKDLFVHQLSHVLEYAEQIQRIDTAGVPPTSQVLSHMPADRPDELRPGLTNEEALANAPDRSLKTGLFRVPRVFS